MYDDGDDYYYNNNSNSRTDATPFMIFITSLIGGGC